MVQHTIHLIMYSLNQIREVALVLGIGVNKVTIRSTVHALPCARASFYS